MLASLPMLVSADKKGTKHLLSQSVPGPPAQPQTYSGQPHTNSSKRDKKKLAELVSLRAREEGIRDFVSHCAVSCGKGLWAKVPRR
jgi:hypothetical protein